MKKLLILTVLSVLTVSASFAADFSPPLLKLSADPVIKYDFDGANLEIPVQVSGTPAGIILSIFTKGKADVITDVRNGFLGWHYVNKVDTCIYYSPLTSAQVGETEIVWDGRDQDGNLVPPGEYTYYLWAYDNQSAKTKMSQYISYSRYARIQELDEQGLPLSNPFWYSRDKRWRIGGDPMDSTLVESTTINLAEGWNMWGLPMVDPSDFDMFYVGIYNKDASIGSLHKFKWVPDGNAELQTDFGDAGFAETFVAKYFVGSGSSGATVDGDYIYSSTRCGTCLEPLAEFYVFDKDGSKVDMIDLTSWWSSPSDQEAGGQMNGGPSYFTLRDGYVFMNHYGCCLHQMVNPSGYLESGDMADFWVWSNGNGDYTLDHNFEETSSKPWVCNDFNVGPYIYTIATDANHFTVGNAYDAGAVSFGLLGPDGTGYGYLAYAGETAGWKKCTLVVDADTPFDGFYCDNQQTGGPHYDLDKEKIDKAMYFIGHDSISGVITSAVAVEDDAPAAFSVEQNTPNPFNPATTINFSLAEAGDVTVEVFNIAGQKVDTLADGFMEAGRHSVVWNASGFSAGVYFYTVKSGGHSKTMKMTLVK